MSVLATFQKYQQQVETAVDEILETEVAETVKDIMEEKLSSVVYSYPATENAMAMRRYANGGLQDRSNMQSRVEADHTLIVENDAPLQGTPTGDALSDVVNAGYSNYKQPYARQFVQSTEQEAASGRVAADIMSGLQRRGIT